MKRILRIAVLLLFILGGMTLLNHIVAIRFLEMQYQIQRDRFLNFELSSRMLIFRMRDLVGQRSMRDELSGSVLETQILSELEGEFHSLTLLDRFSLLGMNGVRLLMLKSPLQLESGPGSLKTLQVAFYFERTRHYPSATRVYRTAINEMDLSSDSGAFALLHLGFCHVVGGDIEEALRLLEKVRSEHSGTHFGETADVLIRMILQGDREAKAIENSKAPEVIKARRLTAIGRCVPALAHYSKTDSDEGLDLFNRAYCLEQSGKTKEAMILYRDAGRNTPALKRQATRRLLIISEFYGGGSAARRYATEEMQADGDDDGLSLMDRARADRKADSPENDKNEPVPDAVNEELSNILKESRSFASLFPEEERHGFIRPDDFDISVEAFGGRTIHLHSAVIDAMDMEGVSGTLRVQIFASEIRRITPGAEGQQLRVFLKNGSSFAAKELLSDPKTGGLLTPDNKPIPFEQIVRILGERQ